MTTDKKLPAVSFVIPVLNEENRIKGCLESIKNQEYPEDKMEILVVDGGSTDNTLEIAKEYGCRTIYNPKKLAEPGVALGTKEAKNEIVFVMASDNHLPKKDWIKLMIRPFQDNLNVVGAFTHVLTYPKDNLVNRYYSWAHVDPFTFFVFGNDANPRFMDKSYEIIEKTEEYIIFNFTIENYPLLALAQGFAIKKDALKDRENEYDDILPVISKIEQKSLIAYVPNAGIYHDHLKNFKDFVKKYKNRIEINVYKKGWGYETRKKYLSKKRKLRQKLWIIYSLSFILPFLDSIKGLKRDKDIVWFMHPFMCFALTFIGGIVMIEYAFKKIFKQLQGRSEYV